MLEMLKPGSSSCSARPRAGAKAAIPALPCALQPGGSAHLRHVQCRQKQPERRTSAAEVLREQTFMKAGESTQRSDFKPLLQNSRSPELMGILNTKEKYSNFDPIISYLIFEKDSSF